MADILKASDIWDLDLPDLRRLSGDAIQNLDKTLQETYKQERENAAQRLKRNRVDVLLLEFQASLASDVAGQVEYEHAFVSSWWDSAVTRPLYRARWWINEYAAGVYFIYEEHDQLQYVGSSCGGALGKRIYAKWHEDHRHSVDVVLFERQWCHFAVALEALVISRLKPEKNTSLKNIWIAPPSRFAPSWPPPDLGN